MCEKSLYIQIAAIPLGTAAYSNPSLQIGFYTKIFKNLF